MWDLKVRSIAASTAASTCLWLAVFVSACIAATETRSRPSLYDELGGVEGLRPIVDELVWRLASDDVVGSSLLPTEIASFKEQTLVFLCAVAGGPCLDAGDRPLIGFVGSPSAGARRVLRLVRAAALARGASPRTTRRLLVEVERDIRGFIGPPRG